jgi:hypothetical protein
MATFGLVHGAWGGSWVWQKIIPLLRKPGHDVHVATPTGLGDRIHLADPVIDRLPGPRHARGVDPVDHAGPDRPGVDVREVHAPTTRELH